MTKNKQLSFYILTLILSINLIVGYNVFSSTRIQGEEDQVDSVRVFVDAVRLLRNNYVDEDKVAYQKLVYAAIDGMVKELDKHSRFHTPVENKEVKEDSAGQFAGIGVTMQFLEKKLKVNRIIPNGPASRSDLRPDDVIIAVDGVSIVGEGLVKARSLIKGEKGSEVLLTVYRTTVDAEIQIPIIRDVVKVPSITRIRQIADSGVGYMYINQFTKDTDQDFEKAIRDFQSKGVRGVIVDVRNNPGGMLDTAINMCSLFVPEDELILYTQGRDGSNRKEYRSRGGSKFFDLPIIILANEGSASASEILSACLSDYQKTIIIGAKTYGKGSVQTIIDLRDGSALRFTIAKYYTKGGRTIHNVGITPDIPVHLSKSEQRDLNKVLADLFPSESEMDDYDKDDKQLQAALGLMSDIFRDKPQDQKILEFFDQNREKFLKSYSVSQKSKKQSN